MHGGGGLKRTAGCMVIAGFFSRKCREPANFNPPSPSAIDLYIASLTFKPANTTHFLRKISRGEGGGGGGGGGGGQWMGCACAINLFSPRRTARLQTPFPIASLEPPPSALSRKGGRKGRLQTLVTTFLSGAIQGGVGFAECNSVLNGQILATTLQVALIHSPV